MSRPKGLAKTGGRQKGSKNKVTLLTEERRARFDEKESERWDETIDKLHDKYPTYVADQFMGPAPQKIDALVKIIPFDELPEDISIRKNKTNHPKNKSDTRRNSGGKDNRDSDVPDSEGDARQETDPNKRGFREFSSS